MMAAVAVALLAAGAAAAADEQPAQPKTKKICRVEDDTGTRLGGHRVCKTVVERQQPVRSERPEASEPPAEASNASN
jgi:hypothetical protein